MPHNKLPRWLSGKEPLASSGHSREGSVPGSGKSPGEGNGNHSSILAWEISRTEEPGGLHPWGWKGSDMTIMPHNRITSLVWHSATSIPLLVSICLSLYFFKLQLSGIEMLEGNQVTLIFLGLVTENLNQIAYELRNQPNILGRAHFRAGWFICSTMTSDTESLSAFLLCSALIH